MPEALRIVVMALLECLTPEALEVIAELVEAEQDKWERRR